MYDSYYENIILSDYKDIYCYFNIINESSKGLWLKCFKRTVSNESFNALKKANQNIYDICFYSSKLY